MVEKKQLNMDKLSDEGILSPKYLSADAIRAIELLPDEDIEALIRINKKLSLNTFFKGDGPEI